MENGWKFDNGTPWSLIHFINNFDGGVPCPSLYFHLNGCQKPKKNRKSFVAIKDADAPYQPKVSILITARNEERVLGGILQRMTELTYPKDKLQVIVVDDASTDKTGAIAEQYSRLYQC